MNGSPAAARRATSARRDVKGTAEPELDQDRTRRGTDVVVFDESMLRRPVAAQWALGIPPEVELAKAHRQGVEQQQPAEQRLAHAEQQFERLVGLDDPMMPGNTPSTPPSAQLGTEPGGGGSGNRQR